MSIALAPFSTVFGKLVTHAAETTFFGFPATALVFSHSPQSLSSVLEPIFSQCPDRKPDWQTDIVSCFAPQACNILSWRERCVRIALQNSNKDHYHDNNSPS